MAGIPAAAHSFAFAYPSPTTPEARMGGKAATRVAEVALALGNAPRLLRRWLTGSLLATAASALPLAASSSRQ